MNGLIRAASRLPHLRNASNPVRQSLYARNVVKITNVMPKRLFARTIWHMCSTRCDAGIYPGNKLNRHSELCSCGCGIHGVHTKSDKELVEFLNEEIAVEKKSLKMTKTPSEFEGFSVQFDGSDVNLTKKMGDEIVNISFNVNHTVDSDPGESNVNPQTDKPDLGEMKSKPSFEVDVKRGNRTLSFTCSFVDNAGDHEGDIFGIDEMTMFEGEWNEKVYAVSGEILDGYLYDLMMSQLEDRGISNEFVDKLSEFSTQYEHKCYINLLEDIQKFSSGK